MSNATLYVEGETWEIMGNVVDKFLGYNNTTSAARSGKNFVSTEIVPRTLTVDQIKVDPREFIATKDYLQNCASKKMTVTVSIDEGCGDSAVETQYLNCTIEGEPTFSFFEKQISGFVIAYEQRIEF